MNAYFEEKRERDEKIQLFNRNDKDFPLHFHANIEICLQISGSSEIICDGDSYILAPGDIAFFDSYHIHAYRRECFAGEQNMIILIPAKYSATFRAKFKDRRPISPIVQSEQLGKDLLFLKRLLEEHPEGDVTSAAVDLILFLIAEHLTFSKNSAAGETDIIHKTLRYIHEHYRENINLNSICRALGYSPEHISRVFHKYTKTGIPAYINKLRMDYVRQNIGQRPISELVFDAGFGSLQTYYRARKKFKA